MPLTCSKANKRENVFMRDVTLTCRLYKRKGVRSCWLMRQVNRLLMMIGCWWNDVIGERSIEGYLGRVSNCDYAISEIVFSAVDRTKVESKFKLMFSSGCINRSEYGLWGQLISGYWLLSCTVDRDQLQDGDVQVSMLWHDLDTLAVRPQGWP